MGYMLHDAVIVEISGYVADGTTPSAPVMPDIAAFRESLPENWRPLVIGPVQTVANGNYVAAFLPDGSKEGWPDSDAGDEYREQFIKLFDFAYEDGSTPFDVVAVRFGGDEPEWPRIRVPRQTRES